MGKYTNRNNCMAYALGRSNWMIPKFWRLYEDTQDSDDYVLMVDTMEKMFNLKRVERHDMSLGKEYIAFRVEQYQGNGVGDFHFMKRHKTGHWTHKMGSRPVAGVSEKFVFSDSWGNQYHNYDSEIVLFEKLS
jgi:hypothetical protein